MRPLQLPLGGSSPAIDGQRVRSARELRLLTQSALAEAVDVDQTMIAHIENGSKSANSELIQAIADVLMFPASYFARPAGVLFSKGSLLFRSKAGVGKRVVASLHAHASLLFEIVLELSQHVTLFPVKLESSSNPTEAARFTRIQMGCESGPVIGLLRKVERLGVILLPLPPVDGADAFAVWAGARREFPIIGFLPSRSTDRIRLSVAHELGHLILHREYGGAAPNLEPDAFHFACELLMPAAEIAADFSEERITLLRLAALKSKWQVSIQALCRRARELQFISDRQYRYLQQQLSAKGWRTDEPCLTELHLEKPRLIKKMVEVAYGKNFELARVSELLDYPVDVLQYALGQSAEAPGPARGQIIKFPLALRQ
jgi:Zn-dependent peptidase ImmA (M78 family)/transcriptional regulator with XRE-family HTH domain